MNITVDRDNLKAALARTRPAVSRNSQLAILGGVRIDPDQATLQTTNLDLTITTDLDADGSGEPVVVPHDRLAALVAACPVGAVKLELADDVLHITAGRIDAKLRTLPAAEWPRVPEVDGEVRKLADGDWLAIRRVLHARSYDPSRPVLCQVQVAGGNATTSDSYRLATHAGVDDALDVLLPGDLVAAVVATNSDDVAISHDSRAVQLAAGGTIWQASLLGQPYPTWQQLIPPSRDVTCTTDRAQLLEALAAIGSIGLDDAVSKDAVVARLAIDANGLVVSGVHRELGEVVVPLDADTAGNCDVWFNATYLVDALRHLEGDSVRLEGVDDLKPWLAIEGDHRELVMPFRKPSGAR